jgi:uncharacterized membrane protein
MYVCIVLFRSLSNVILLSVYIVILLSVRELEEESVKKWQRNWTQTTKGSETKEFFPNVEERLKMKINLTQNFTAICIHTYIHTYIHTHMCVCVCVCVYVCVFINHKGKN